MYNGSYSEAVAIAICAMDSVHLGNYHPVCYIETSTNSVTGVEPSHRVKIVDKHMSLILPFLNSIPRHESNTTLSS